MNDATLDSLRTALQFSPDNSALRQILAESLLGLRRFEEAEEHYRVLVSQTNSPQARFGLATIFFETARYSPCNVVLEELVSEPHATAEMFLLYAKGLLREQDVAGAIAMYQRALDLDPDCQDSELDQNLRLSEGQEEEEGEELESLFLEKPEVRFAHVGGMDHVKKEIELKIIKPLQHPELYKAYGKKVGGGILLYGPPGCGKTYLARATAGEVEAKFISISLNQILDMWIGNSEKNLHEVFELARRHAPCVVFIDELDALGASRSDMKQSAGRHLINQFLQELDGVEANNDGLLIIGATNSPWSVDAAFRRPGRFDRIIFVPPPDERSRENILRLKLSDKPSRSVDVAAVARKTENYSGADLDALLDIAIEQKLEDSFRDGVPKPLETADLLAAAKKHKPTTLEWFATARNFALFANDSGLYDEVLAYLKIKK